MEAVVSNHLRALRYDALLSSLLLDNVQYHLEGGGNHGLFLATHALADAPWQRHGASLAAGRLGNELLSFWPRLRDLPCSSLALSWKTYLASQESFPASQERSPVLQSTVDWHLPYDFSALSTLNDLLGALVNDLIQITRDAPPKSRLSVNISSARGVWPPVSVDESG